MRISTVPVVPHEAGSRFAFYTNECVGLGHLRRALLLSRAVTERDPAASALVVTGAPVEPDFRLPPRVDTVKLPVLTREQEGTHRPRLALDVEETQRLRGTLALAIAQAYRPTVAIVDKLPLGLGDELVPALESLRATSTRLVLGLRDIEDDSLAVRRRWNDRLRRAVRRYYDAILVYGPSTSKNALDSAGWTDLDLPVHHVGYVGPAMPAEPPRDLAAGYLLVTVGGGADGFALASSFLAAARLAPLAHPAVVVTGPLMPGRDVRRVQELAAGLDVRVFELRPDMESVVAGARAVVAMAGYNTVSELLRARKPALLVPRVRPSSEQLLRAQALAGSGRARLLHPDELTPQRLRVELESLLAMPAPAGGLADADGAERAADLLSTLALGPAEARA